MTRGLDFSILGYLAGSGLEPLERATLASLSIRAGSARIPITEVEDRVAQTVRGHINVPAHSVARWLLANFWRLRWEPERSVVSSDWLQSHTLAAIDGGHAWPGLVFASDGEFVQLRLQAEDAADVAAIRYLRDVTIDVPVTDFEEAVLEFADQVESRVAAVLPKERELALLHEELAEERRDPSQAASCKLQALAGLDPGSASTDWLATAKNLAEELGEVAAEELLAVSPGVPDGLEGILAAVSAMRDAKATVRLDRAALRPTTPVAGEPPWRRGERLAAEVRARLGLDPGPLPSSRLEELLDAQLPLQQCAWLGTSELSGGYRNGRADGRTALLVPTGHPLGQRFYLARLIGAASQLSSDQRVLAVSKARTALQKLERAFAAEFLCPWRDLDAFTDECGTDDDGIAEAAAHFDVSDRLVLTSLVNKGKVRRSRLISQL